MPVQIRQLEARLAVAAQTLESERVDAVLAGLKENGLVDGRDFTLEVIYADGDYQRFPELTQQALARKRSGKSLARV